MSPAASRISSTQAQTANKNLALAEAGQVLDRFQKGMQMLSESNEETERIGGVIILERLAIDHPEDYGEIVIEALNGIVSREATKRTESTEEIDGSPPSS